MRIDVASSSPLAASGPLRPARAERAPAAVEPRSSGDAGVIVELSERAQAARAEAGRDGGRPSPGAKKEGEGSSSGSEARGAGGKPLEAEEKAEVQRLAARDAEVRAHEAAHAAAAGGLGGGPSYSYEQGPDGKRYAVEGEVQVQVEKGRTPEETIRNAQTVRAAALAPAQPSSQDRAVAADAAALEAEARQELAEAQKAAPEGLLLNTLDTERRASNGGRDHAHEEGCGFCSRAASRYAA